MANPDLLGYAKAVYIYAVIECVLFCISIFGLIFLYFPIIGMRICKKWDVSEAKCVGFVRLISLQYYIWHIVKLILCCLGVVGGLTDPRVLAGALPGFLLQCWIFYVTKKTYELLARESDTPEQLTQGYQSAHCKCI